MTTTRRIGIPIDQETNDRLNKILPWGVKAQVVRELIRLLIETQAGSKKYIVSDLLAGNCELCLKSKQSTESENDD